MPLMLYQTLKMTIGVMVAILMAYWLKLDFVLSAGSITMITLLDVKRNSLHLGLKRTYTCAIALFLSSLIFSVFGFTYLDFGIFLLFFIPVCLYLDAVAGLVINTVLVSHLFTNGVITLQGVVNEFWLMFIGLAIALLFNLHSPRSEKKIIDAQKKIDEALRSTLRSLAANLKNTCVIEEAYVTLDELKMAIDHGIHQANNYNNSYYLKNNHYFTEYFNMRDRQFERLKYMKEHVSNTVFITQREADILSDFTSHIAEAIHEYNTGEKLMGELKLLRFYFNDAQLPRNREEFENRARLYQYLNDLEAFIMIKIAFAKSQVT